MLNWQEDHLGIVEINRLILETRLLCQLRLERTLTGLVVAEAKAAMLSEG